MRIHLNLLLLSLFSSVTIAGQWTPEVAIETLYIHKKYGGFTLLKVSDSSTNPDDCDTNWYAIEKSENPVFEDQLSVLLTAYTTERKVQLWVEGCSPHNSPLIHHVKMSK